MAVVLQRAARGIHRCVSELYGSGGDRVPLEKVGPLSSWQSLPRVLAVNQPGIRPTPIPAIAQMPSLGGGAHNIGPESSYGISKGATYARIDDAVTGMSIPQFRCQGLGCGVIVRVELLIERFRNTQVVKLSIQATDKFPIVGCAGLFGGSRHEALEME